ncbi:glycosyltransferase family 4 protein [uncultured Thiodictyon sp.]|uniref:glycosyltransferase family 4 protein n=1 Tax=uncultured Thiodictyon sp. TaxID=1846217 RepID=UPI0025CD100D|nr:glycosyltransferase family 4 protein [uncultured Thiodictyon sp.]
MRDCTPARVAIVATHPIQYQIPWFQGLSERPELDLKVFFGLLPDATQQGVGFGVGFHWDIPLLDGYRWELLANVSKAPSLGAFGGCDTPAIGRVLRRWAPDVVILTGWHSRMLMQAWWACRWLGIPLVVRGDSNNLAWRPWWKRLLHRQLLSQVNGVLAVGQANRDFYLESGVSPKRIDAAPHFVDNQRFTAAAVELERYRAELRRDWGIPVDATCFLFSGKLIPKKHPLDLLRALGLANRLGARARAHVLVAGAGELMEPARALAADERLPVTFAGFLNQTELARAYVAADCLVLPSDCGETWGLVVNEAMACARPAIVSDQVGCGPDLIVAGATGATFPTGDVAALADRLCEFAGDGERLRAMGVEARQLVLAGYSVERAVGGTLAAVNKVLGRSR